MGPKKIPFDNVMGMIDAALEASEVVKGFAHFLSRLGTIQQLSFVQIIRLTCAQMGGVTVSDGLGKTLTVFSSSNPTDERIG